MTLSELILLIRWEVQKSTNLVDELIKTDDLGNSVVGFGLDKFELTIPVSISERDVYYSKINKNVSDERFRKFYYPLIIQSDEEILGNKDGIPRKKKGKVLDVDVTSYDVDDKLNPNVRIGQMKITLIKS